MPGTTLDEYRHKVITDPVHGDIGLSQLEVDLINTQSFQRLRRLKQLGLASLVYPAASHSRFAHSLGVFHIMSRAIDLLRRRRKFSNAEQRTLRVAALLHDIGHYPYSHLLEYIDLDPQRPALMKGEKHKLGSPYPDHEKLGELIVTQRRDIASKLQKAKLDPGEVAHIVRGTHALRKYNQLIHSTLDLDRMDYLARDALSTGVPFGRVDLHYLLSNLDIDAEDNLVVHQKAGTAVEHFIVARYFMSKAVYLHKTVFGFESLMRQTLLLLRRAGRLWKDGKEIEQIVRHPTKFLSFDDGFVDGLIHRRAEAADGGSPLGRLCRAIRDRKPPKLLLEVSSLTSKDANRSEELVRFVTRRREKLAEAAKRCDIPKECWLSEDPKKISFEQLGPFMTLTEAASAPPDEASELVRLVDENGRTSPLIENKSSIVHHLSRLRFHMARLYVVEDDPSKVSKARQEVESWLKP